METTPKRKSTGILLLLPFLVSACSSGVVKSLAEVVALRAALIKEYGEEGVNVKLNNGTVLVIAFVNSALNSKGSRERAERAQATARFVKQHYEGINRIHEVWVSFVKQETHYVVIHTSESLGVFAFDKNAQSLSRAGHNAGTIHYDNELEPRVTYLPNSQETDISLNRLQLNGNIYEGLALIPHFTIRGDTTQNRSASPPDSVGFDFAASSKGEIFAGETAIKIFIDENLAFKSKGTFQGGKSSDGTYSKFLYLKLSYPQFRRLTEGERVDIVLAEEKYTLSGEQLGALRSMRDYVEE